MLRHNNPKNENPVIESIIQKPKRTNLHVQFGSLCFVAITFDQMFHCCSCVFMRFVWPSVD